MIYCTKNFRHTLIILTASLASFTSCSQTHTRNTNYNYSKPINLGDGIIVDNIINSKTDSNQIIELTKLILKDSFPNIHSLLIARDGKLIYENYFSGKDENWGSGLGYTRYDTNILHDTRSISKSVVAACIDIAIQQNKIKSIDDPVFNYLPAYQEYKTALNEKITIRQLLTMSSGIEWDEDVLHGTAANDETAMERSGNPVEYVLSRPMKAASDTGWKYNSGGVQLLAEIIKSVSGDNIDKFAGKYLFDPLGINKYSWTKSHRKFTAAASGLRLTSRDLLKFGMLYLNNGQWNGRQIITRKWVDETLKTQVYRNTSSTTKGYSFLFWTETDTVNNKLFELVIAKGNGGQRIFINRQFNLIVIITAGNYNKTGILNDGQLALDKYILPALR